MKRTIILFIAALGLASSLFAQTPTINQAAVDTLTKDVATAVFANQQGTKAAEILNQLALCAGSCDVVAIIKQVGGWDAVGVKMEELGRLKNTAQFQAMAPGDANAAIRRELMRFYAKFKTDKNYGVPLNQSVQAQIIQKIDRMLPPAVAPQSGPVAGEQAAAGEAESTDLSDESANIDGTAFRMSQLGNELKKERENRIWMIILSAILGLLVGAGVVYFILYRALRKEVERLTRDNSQLSRDLDAARRPKPANELRQSQPTNQRRTDISSPPPPEPLNPAVPVNLTPLSTDASLTPPAIRSGTPVPGALTQPEPVADSQVVASEPIPALVQPQSPASARSEVFYFPPPDPNGQFDNAHRADMLSPESAYWFSTTPEMPDAAKFRFEAEPGRVARFLTYRNYMIEPACDSENSFSSTYTRIVNRRDGEAVLENGTWRVKTKALIRYE